MQMSCLLCQKSPFSLVMSTCSLIFAISNKYFLATFMCSKCNLDMQDFKLTFGGQTTNC